MIMKLLSPVILVLFVHISCSLCEKCESEDDLSLLKSSYIGHSKCSQNHIKNSLQSNIGCKPVPVVLELPWPNNTEIQQVRFQITKSKFKYLKYLSYLEIVWSVSGNFRFLPKSFCEKALLWFAENAWINGRNKTCALKVLAETQLV